VWRRGDFLANPKGSVEAEQISRYFQENGDIVHIGDL
jgi:hypothetical protein